MVNNRVKANILVGSSRQEIFHFIPGPQHINSYKVGPRGKLIFSLQYQTRSTHTTREPQPVNYLLRSEQNTEDTILSSTLRIIKTQTRKSIENFDKKDVLWQNYGQNLLSNLAINPKTQ